MMALRRHLFGPTPEDVTSTVEQVLRERNWDVRHEPILARARPDILAESPHGRTYVINIKQDASSADLGAIAQVESFREAVTVELHKQATGVLVVIGEDSPRLRDLAAGAGVEVVVAGAGDPATVRESLTRAGVLGAVATTEVAGEHIAEGA
jgi:hypothetical protein